MNIVLAIAVVKGCQVGWCTQYMAELHNMQAAIPSQLAAWLSANSWICASCLLWPGIWDEGVIRMRRMRARGTRMTRWGRL